MGIKCARIEKPLVTEEPVFLYQNMITMRKNKNPRTEYEFLEKIGKGSFSQVFKARNILTGNIRAIKQIECRNNPRLQKLIMSEFNILRKLDHPNIMKMYQYFEDGPFVYITAELCPGKEFFQFIVENKFIPQKKAREIFYDIACAIRYMHDNHFMHRDLKPENILFDPNTGSLKVVDLGSALDFENSQCCQRKRVGTSYYIAPEVLNRNYNQKCDIWSLGVILYIMLCGQPPFKGRDDPAILESVKKSPLQFKKSVWSSVSQKAKELIRGMIERNIQKRLSIEQVVSAAWFHQLLLEKQSSTVSEQEQKSIKSCLANMKTYKDMKRESLQDGIITFIVNFVKNNEDATELQHCFKTLDLNGDGVLSQQELTLGMMKYLDVARRQASAIAEAVFLKADSNRSGFIDYSQFLVAATNFQLTISAQNLDIAFDYLDADRSGKISASQLKQKLGANIPEQTYQGLLQSFDKNSDGQISREQFTAMMRRMINRS